MFEKWFKKREIDDKHYKTVSKIANHFNIKANIINEIFLYLGWAKKENKWLIATEVGIENGAKQKYNTKNKQKYIIWNNKIKNNINFICEVNKFKNKEESIKEKTKDIKIKKMTNKEKKEKGDLYEEFICNYFEEKNYTTINHSKEKGLLDCGIDLIVKNNRNILFIQCKNWEKKYKSRLNKKDIQYIRMNVRDYIDDKEIFKSYNWKIHFIASQDILGKSGKYVIDEFKDEVEYQVIPIDT